MGSCAFWSKLLSTQHGVGRYASKSPIVKWETIQTIQKPQPWATGDWRLHHKNVDVLCRVFLVKHQITLVNHQITLVTQPPTAQIWHSVTSGFSQNYNHLWKGRDFRTSMRVRNIQRGSWWQLREQYKVPRCLFWRGQRDHCPMYNVSCTLYLLQ